MKSILSLSSLLLVLYLFTIQSSLSSCSKDEPITDTVTVIKKDTVYIKDTMMSTAILSSHPWKCKEERGVRGGSIVYYLRGGSNNTESLDNEYLVFNANGTGLHMRNNGTSIPITWVFANADNTKMIWTLLNTPATYSITWDNIRYKNGNMYFDQYYTDGNTGQNAHSQQIRMPQ